MFKALLFTLAFTGMLHSPFLFAASAPQPPAECEVALTQKSLYDELLHSEFTSTDALNILAKADHDPEYREQVIKTLSQNRFARWASEFGLDLKGRILNHVRSYFIPYQWLISPYRTLYNQYLSFSATRLNTLQKPIPPHKASDLAFTDTLEQYPLPPNSRPEDLQPGSAEMYYYQQRLMRHLNKEVPFIKRGGPTLKETLTWAMQQIKSLEKYRTENLKQALRDANQTFGSIYILQNTIIPLGRDGALSLPAGAIKLTSEHIDQATVQFDQWESVKRNLWASRPRAGDSILGATTEILKQLGRLFWTDIPASLLKRDNLTQGKSLPQYEFHIGMLEVPLNDESNSRARLSISDLFVFIGKRLGSVHVPNDDDQHWVRNRLHLYQDVDTVLAATIYDLRELLNKTSVDSFKRDLVKLLQKDNDRHRGSGGYLGNLDRNLLGRITPDTFSSEDDFLTGIEWFGYAFGANHWTSRQLRSPEKIKRERLSLFQRFKIDLKDRFYKARTITAVVSYFAILTASMGGLAHGVFELLPPPSRQSGFLTSSGLSLEEMQSPSNDSETNGPSPFSIQTQSHFPAYFDYAHAAEAHEDRELLQVEELPVATPKQDQVVIENRFPLTTDDSGRIFIPAPRGFRLAQIFVLHPESGRPINSHIVHRHERTGNYILSLSEQTSRRIDYIATFGPEISSTHFTDQESPRFTNLDGDRILEISDLLDDVGITSLSRALFELVHERRTSERPIHVRDIESVFVGTQIYSHEQEAFLNLRSWFSGNPFMEYERFLRADGRLHYECDGGNALLADFLKAYYDNDSNVFVENIGSFVAEYAPESSQSGMIEGEFKFVRHVRTLITDRETQASLMLDGTAIQKQPFPARSHSDWRAYYAGQEALPANRKRTLPPAPPEPDTLPETGLTPPERNHQIQSIEAARARLAQNPTVRELNRRLGNQNTPIRRVMRLSSLVTDWLQGTKTFSEIAPALKEIYPSAAPDSIKTLAEFRQALNVIIKAERLTWEKLKNLSSRDRSRPWFTDLILEENFFHLLELL